MPKKDKLLASFEKVYEQARQSEIEELHNDVVAVIQEHKASVQNILFALDIIKFELMQAKYKEIMGVVKLTDKPPVAPVKNNKK